MAKTWCWIGIAVLQLSLFDRVEAADYYVDSTSGSDSNPGSQTLPWKRCPGMSGWSGTAKLQAGDRVLLHSAGTWTATGTPSLLEPIAGVTYDGKSWPPGGRARLRAGGPLGRAIVTFLQDHPTLPTVVRGFDIDGADQVTAGVAVHWGFTSNDLTGAAKRIEDCLVHDFYSRNQQGTYKYGIVISTWNGRLVRNVEVIGCKVYNTPRTAIVVYPGNDVPTNRVENVLVRGCEVYGTGEDPDAVGAGIGLKNHSVKTVVEYNYLHDTAAGGVTLESHNVSTFRGPEDATVRFNIIRNTGGRNATAGIRLLEAGEKSVRIYGNLITGNDNSGISFDYKLGGKLSAWVYNNTLYQNCRSAGTREIHVVSNTATIAALELKNNLVIARSTITPLIDQDGDITAHASNLYYREGGGTLVLSKSVSYSAASLGSWEASALSEAPGLRAPADLPSGFVGSLGVDLRPSSDGFNLAPGSPAADRGLALAAEYAGSINSVARPSGSGWDLGAYELSQGGPVADRGAAEEGGSTARDGSENLDVIAAGELGGGDGLQLQRPAEGCTCQAGAARAPALGFIMLLLALGVRRRRR